MLTRYPALNFYLGFMVTILSIIPYADVCLEVGKERNRLQCEILEVFSYPPSNGLATINVPLLGSFTGEKGACQPPKLVISRNAAGGTGNDELDIVVQTHTDARVQSDIPALLDVESLRKRECVSRQLLTPRNAARGTENDEPDVVVQIRTDARVYSDLPTLLDIGLATPTLFGYSYHSELFPPAPPAANSPFQINCRAAPWNMKNFTLYTIAYRPVLELQHDIVSADSLIDGSGVRCRDI
ncbi:hypothetical protein BDQ17DRAFT_1327893 [Cyathus striatus]|nr:hypothetical protein BDQ17DRAFT_1327893 [Cyathus striatus]